MKLGALLWKVLWELIVWGHVKMQCCIKGDEYYYELFQTNLEIFLRYLRFVLFISLFLTLTL